MSFFNAGEIREVTSIVSGLLGIVAGPGLPASRNGYYFPVAPGTKHHLKANEISVISPFREQVWKIRVALRAMGLGMVDVGDIESLQGGEK